MNKFGKFTDEGLASYWAAVDAAFQFNAERFAGYGKTSLKWKLGNVQVSHETNFKKTKRHEIQDFFTKKKK